MLQEKDFIHVDPAGTQRFVDAAGKYYTPFGINYFCKGTGWAPHIWYDHHLKEYDRDFSRMQELGINTIRVFTSIATLLPEKYTINETTLGYIREMLEAAASYNIRIIFSGFSGWDGAPAWMEKLPPEDSYYFTGDEMLRQLAYGWYHLAKTCAPYASLFSYDLQNEPFLAWDTPDMPRRWREYCLTRIDEDGVSPQVREVLLAHRHALPENRFAPESPLLFEWQEFRNRLCRRYIKTCVDAIHAADTNHMVSIGLHQNSVPTNAGGPGGYAAFDPHRIADLLDYISIHFYPYAYNDDMDLSDDLAHPEDRILGKPNFIRNENIMSAHIDYCDVGLPVVMEEFGMYGGGKAPDFSWRKPFRYMPQSASSDWVAEAVRRNMARCSGFLNWGFDDAPDQGDPTRYQGLYDDQGNIKELGKVYPTLIREMNAWVEKHPAYVRTTPMEVSYYKLMTDGKYIHDVFEEIQEHLTEKEDPFFRVVE